MQITCLLLCKLKLYKKITKAGDLHDYSYCSLPNWQSSLQVNRNKTNCLFLWLYILKVTIIVCILWIRIENHKGAPKKLQIWRDNNNETRKWRALCLIFLNKILTKKKHDCHFFICMSSIVFSKHCISLNSYVLIYFPIFVVYIIFWILNFFPQKSIFPYTIHVYT